MDLTDSVNGMAVWTAEDIVGAKNVLHPVQEALVQCHASQCGFCTPGFVMSLFAMYQNHTCKGRAISREMAQAELRGTLPAGMTKADYADFKFSSAIVEEDDFDMLVMGRTFTADDAHTAGFVNVVVSPGHTEAEARKVAREICALPAEAVAISRKLLKLPPEDMTRRIDQEGHLFGERMRSTDAIAAFKAFFARKKS